MENEESSLRDTLGPILALLMRRRWYVLLTAAATVVATAAVLYQIPNRYTSEATLFVVEQQVPQRYVTPTSTTELAEALPAMTEEVLSRNRLMELVDQFNLFPEERRKLAPEELDALVRKYLTIEALPPAPGHKGANAFKISFTASKAILAQKVTSELTSLFIQENLKTRGDQARNTTNFLQAEREAAKAKLDQEEEILRDFKTKYLGELPEQQQGNLAILSGAQAQLSNIDANIDRTQQRRAYLESLLSAYQRLASRNRALAAVAASERTGTAQPVLPNSKFLAAQSEVTNLQAQRAKLAATLSPRHPDVVAIDREIAEARARLDGLALPAESAPSKTAQGSEDSEIVPEADEDVSIAQVRSELESNRIEIANFKKEEERQKGVISEYQSRLNLTPVREQQLAGILRDYDLSKKDYEDLLSKEQESELAMSLEKQQGGEQFRLVDPPSLPELPSSPKRLKISLSAVGGGLVLGLILAFAAETKRPAFYTERDVVRKFGVPLVVGLPLLRSRSDQRRKAWTKAGEWLAGVSLVGIIMTAEVWVFLHP